MGNSADDTVLMLQKTFNEEALSMTQVYGWYTRFIGGEMSCDEQPRSGRHSTCRNSDFMKSNFGKKFSKKSYVQTRNICKPFTTEAMRKP